MVVQVCRTNLYLAIAVFDDNLKFKVQISSMEFSILSRCNKNVLPTSLLTKFCSSAELLRFFDLPVYAFSSFTNTIETELSSLYLLLFLPSNPPSCPLPAPSHIPPSHIFSFFNYGCYIHKHMYNQKLY